MDRGENSIYKKIAKRLLYLPKHHTKQLPDYIENTPPRETFSAEAENFTLESYFFEQQRCFLEKYTYICR